MARPFLVFLPSIRTRLRLRPLLLSCANFEQTNRLSAPSSSPSVRASPKSSSILMRRRSGIVSLTHGATGLCPSMSSRLMPQ
jgi:hypothetical protein